MNIWAGDIEAIGLLDVVHGREDVHCIAFTSYDGKETVLFHDHDTDEYSGNFVVKREGDDKDEIIEEDYEVPLKDGDLSDGIKWLQDRIAEGAKIAIHNVMGYDIHVLERLAPDYEWDRDAFIDTFVQSKVQWFERPRPRGATSPHGLQAWGIRTGVPKPPIEDFTGFGNAMLHRVLEDIEIQRRTTITLERERESILEKYGLDFSQGLKIETAYAYLVTLQELHGVKVDEPHIDRCIKELDQLTENLAKEIEPTLPPSLRVTGEWLTKRELAAALGFDAKRIKDEPIGTNDDGSPIYEKPYRKPSTNYQRVVKSNAYSGFHITHGDSPVFEKRGEFVAWRNENHPKTKPAEWEVTIEETERKVLNKNTSEYFDVEETSDLVGGVFTRVSFEPSTLTQHEVVKGFLIKLGWRVADEWNFKREKGQVVRAEEAMEVRYPRRAAPENQMVYSVKKGEPVVTSPVLSNDDFEQLPEGLGRKIGDYNTYMHRRRFFENPSDPENKGLKSFITEDSLIGAGVNNFATRTGRSSHRVILNLAGAKALYGREVRGSFISREGKVFVGADMKSAQLSIAAYYANNEAYYNNVASGKEYDNGVYVGESAHCVNARAFGMVEEELHRKAVETQDKELLKKIGIIRAISKGGSFATIFGASGKKVAATIGIPESRGNAAKERFLSEMGLDNTLKFLKQFSKKYPRAGGYYLPLAFGYHLWNNSSHKDLNTIVQGFEALAQKLASIRLDAELKRHGLDKKAHKVIDYHDEYITECDEDVAEEVGNIMGECYTWSGQMIHNFYRKNPRFFPNFQVPDFFIDLNGGYSIGKTYADVS